MYLRPVLLSMLMALLFVPASHAQKRTFARIDPNADAINGNADLYIPSSGSFSTTTGSMNVPREQHFVITLSSGKVLIMGGYNNHYLDSAELFDPGTGLFSVNLQTTYNEETGITTTAVGKMNKPRSGAGAVRLLDGSVFIAGGYNGSYLSAAETYDPATGEFVALSRSMTDARNNPTATLLNDGKVLLTGGFNGEFLASAELYDSFSFLFHNLSPMSEARDGHRATLLEDGTVLITGGCANAQTNRLVCDKYIGTAEIFETEEGFTQTGEMITPRANHTASLLPDGRVLIAGGNDGNGFLNTAEIYDPETGVFTQIAAMGAARSGHTATTTDDGRILLAGGFSGAYLSSAEIFNPDSGLFTPVSGAMGDYRSGHAATLLNDGRVLFTGGRNSDLLVFDVNTRSSEDNVSPNIVFSSDSQTGFVPYTGSGTVLAFSPETGEVLARIETGGEPAFITPLLDGDTLAVVSVFDNRIFLIDTDTLSLKATYAFSGAVFGFGSILALSPDGSRGYVSSTGTGEVIQFDVATGHELGRLEELETPAQITVTPDGSTLLVVDTTLADVLFVDTASMNIKFTMAPRDIYPYTGFTIFNKPVLSPDGEYGVIASRDITTVSDANTLFYFKTSTGEITLIRAVGINPGFTALTPDEAFWLVLSSESMAFIPVAAPGTSVIVETTGAVPIGSSNIVFSQDSRYAFFAGSSSDLVLQQDLETAGVVGGYLVGDDPNNSMDQPSSMAMTPDGKTIVVLNFASNGLEFLTDASALRVIEFVSDRDKFTGLTLINLSSEPAEVSVTPVTNFGTSSFQLDDGSVSSLAPYKFEPPLGPYEQRSVELSPIFNFNNSETNQGHLLISSDSPGVVGFAVTGTIQASYLGSSITKLDGLSLYKFPDQLHDWIVPDVPAKSDSPVELSLLNPNYNATDYDITRYGFDGTKLEAKIEATLSPSYREVNSTADLFSGNQLGNVLLTGGRGPQARNWAEIYVPSSTAFTVAGADMNEARYGHAAVLLGDGRVLLSGGRNGYQVNKSAELYDPIYRTFDPVIGTMRYSRYRHTATRLNSGKVLVAGGQNSISINASAELFDPETDTFSVIEDAMDSPRDSHTATLLPDGRVLLAGGIDGIGISESAEIYNPATSSFGSTSGHMENGRAFHKAVLLQDGKVLITGGYDGSYLDSAELFDPATGRFEMVSPMNEARSNHTATLLSDGIVLITGGMNASGALDTAEVYIPSTGRFFTTESTMTSARSHHTATLLANGNVLLANGTDGSDAVVDSDLYASDHRVFSPLVNDQMAQWSHTATLLQEPKAGYLRGFSSKGIMVRERHGTSIQRTAMNGIDVEKYSGITRLYSPQFVTLLPDRTILNLINANDDTDANVTITLHDAGGNILGAPVAIFLPVSNQINDDLLNIFRNYPEVRDREGWIEVVSDVDYIVGTVSFVDSANTVLTTFELSGTPLTDFVYPLASENSDYQTLISLLNSEPDSGNQSATVRIELRGLNGAVENSTSVVLAPNSQRSGFLSDYFSGLAPRLYGYVLISSDRPIHSFSSFIDKNGKFACAVPPIPVPVSAPEE